jgi:hypothetical protein
MDRQPAEMERKLALSAIITKPIPAHPSPPPACDAGDDT